MLGGIGLANRNSFDFSAQLRRIVHWTGLQVRLVPAVSAGWPSIRGRRTIVLSRSVGRRVHTIDRPTKKPCNYVTQFLDREEMAFRYSLRLILPYSISSSYRPFFASGASSFAKLSAYWSETSNSAVGWRLYGGCWRAALWPYSETHGMQLVNRSCIIHRNSCKFTPNSRDNGYRSAS